MHRGHEDRMGARAFIVAAFQRDRLVDHRADPVADVTTQAERDAFSDASAAAFVLAATVALAAVPIARYSLRAPRQRELAG